MKSMDQQLKDLKNAFNKYAVDSTTATDAGLTTCAIVVQGDAVNLVPVDTGLLKKSIMRRLIKYQQGRAAQVGTNVEYAPFQEFGTAKMAAQPFLTPALNSNKSKIKAIMIKALSGVKV